MMRNPLQGRTGWRLGRRRQAGVGLIEVLVAVLVLSIGFVGMAALQARSLSTNNSAMVRSLATIASYSILDAMRADLASARNGDYNGPVKSASCPPFSTSTLAQAQLAQWCTSQLSSLGSSAVGTVTCTPVAGTNTANCSVTIQFDDSRAGDSASTPTFVTQAML